MKHTLRALAIAIAAIAGGTIVAPAHATGVAPNPADFQIIENPGQYTVINNSSIWYIYAFAVSNPDAAVPGINAFANYKNWSGLSPNPSLDLNTGNPVPVFAYASADIDLSNGVNNATLGVVDFANYIAPGTSSDQFFYGTNLLASAYGLLVVANIGGANVFDSVNGVNTDTTPLPAALPLFAGGLGALGLLGWRKKRKSAAAG